MQHLTPIAALIGGSLIGLSTLLLGLGNGRIAGINGIVRGLMASGGSDRGWRLIFLIGLLIAPLGYTAIAGLRIPPWRL